MRWALKLVDGPSAPNPGVSAETALKGVAGTAATALSKEAAALETRALAKAKADPQWALRVRAEADGYRTLPSAKKDAKPEEIEALAAKKREFLMKLLAEFEQ
jgi:hypothetical protein